MGRPSPSEPALLFIGALYREEKYLSVAKERLIVPFGEIVMESAPHEWDYSDYYRDELGWPISRVFFFLKNGINPENIADIKLLTNEIERQLSTEGKRSINLDPGYLTSAKVVLASTKNYSHRIYIGKGIYAEITLLYRDGRYQPHLFTYPDYASDEYIKMFVEARKFLKGE